MKLYLARHGEALSVSEYKERPLTAKGQQEVTTIAKFLRRNNIIVDEIYHSGKLRAEQTAATLATGIISNPTIRSFPGLLPDDPVKPIAVYCNHWQEDVMIVGHLPFLACLVSELLFDRGDRPCVDFNTGSILCLDRLAIFHWSLTWFVSPHLLTDL